MPYCFLIGIRFSSSCVYIFYIVFSFSFCLLQTFVIRGNYLTEKKGNKMSNLLLIELMLGCPIKIFWSFSGYYLLLLSIIFSLILFAVLKINKSKKKILVSREFTLIFFAVFLTLVKILLSINKPFAVMAPYNHHAHGKTVGLNLNKSSTYIGCTFHFKEIYSTCCLYYQIGLGIFNWILTLWSQIPQK